MWGKVDSDTERVARTTVGRVFGFEPAPNLILWKARVSG